ncbi:PilZ domain-containing protein [Aureimonas sp. AU40]|uniref:PilZ domain-containing protein n=1 Tax=Aureimonas sp. AU40 TaxID=1637747 RepID=UPI000783951F|nr:PilZ domain-containing protein [Aureimonas sp. AU40]
MLSPLPAIPLVSEDRRHFKRVKVDLLGRFMRESQEEYPCRIDNVSPGGIAVISAVEPRSNERIILYADHIGRIEGSVVRAFAGGFALQIQATDRKREKLAAQLTWLANRHELSLPEDRRHERIQPRNPIIEMVLEDGRRYQVRIIDLSLSGAAIACAVRPANGSKVTLGTMQGRVVRQLEDGLAIEFSTLQTAETLNESFR